MSGDTTGQTDDRPAVYDHYRPSDGTDTVADGVYRVVGTGDGTATLLRVGDADGRRVHTGAVETVDRDALTAFETAENPDANRSPFRAIRSQLDGMLWSLRLFPRSLAARPLPSAVALALFALGTIGEGVLGLPEPSYRAATFVGAFGLAYLGTRGAD